MAWLGAHFTASGSAGAAGPRWGTRVLTLGIQEGEVWARGWLRMTGQLAVGRVVIDAIVLKCRRDDRGELGVEPIITTPLARLLDGNSPRYCQATIAGSAARSRSPGE